MSLSPPQPAEPGQPYYLSFVFLDFVTGTPVDPTSLQLTITYGGSGPAVEGPVPYTGASSEARDTIWRTGTGRYTFRWDVPASGLLPGVYVATWTSIYGSSNDEFDALENFPIVSGGPFVAVPSGDIGYWTGSLTYQPSWSPSPLAIEFGETDANGITWLWQKIQGWDSAPSVGSVIQRSADHGGWPAPQFLGPRLITLTVMASAPTQALRDLARALLQQAVPIGTSSSDLATLVYGEPVPKQALVRRNASSKVSETYPTLADVVFSIPLVAPDPRKYSTQLQTASVVLPVPIINPLVLPFASGLPVSFPGGIPPESVTISALNSGTFETRPQLTLTGPVTGPAIVNATAGQQISFSSLTLAATDILTIDLDNRQAFLNGQFTAADPFSSWWVLQPGTSSIYVSGASPGGATLTMTWRSAWL